MIASNYLLLLLGILGGIDILLYHSISHGIRTHVDSRFELMTHALCGPTYMTLFLVVPNLETHGWWAIALGLLLVLDFAISVTDFALERKSRAELGGLPSGEYVLHMMIAMAFGAFVMALAPTLALWMAEPSGFVFNIDSSAQWLRAVLAIFAAGVFCSGTMDFMALIRLKPLKA
jgi:hypothetical protein